MPLRWASCLFRPAKGTAATSIEVNSTACPPELHEQLTSRGTACLRPRGAHIIYERIDDAGQGAFTPPVVIYIKRLPVCTGGLEVCIKRTAVTHFVGRAAREARLQVQLQHPHLLPAFASVRGRHHYYLVLPAAEGDLWAEAEAMRQQGTGYSEGELREVARQLLMGLAHLHTSNLAHRDIKPANVLRLPDGRVAVADFGCADGCTAGFVAAGTTQFQPPECRRNEGAQLAVLPKSYDQRLQDMWSLGATLASLWFAALPEVIRGSGNSRVSAAAAAAAAVADAAAAAAAAAGSDWRDSSDGSTSSNCSTSEPVGGASAGDVARVSDGPAAAPPPAPALPRFLAAAGFASCSSTRGACGSAMSAPFLDLLSRLLRLRPSERLTANRALQHEWLTAAAAGHGGGGGCCAVSCEAAAMAAGGGEEVTPAMVRPILVAAAEPTEPTAAASLPPSPVSRTRTSADGRFMPFASHQQLMLHEAASMTTAPPPAAAEAYASAVIADGSGQQHQCEQAAAHPHSNTKQDQEQQGSGCSPTSSVTASTCPATPGSSSSSKPSQLLPPLPPLPSPPPPPPGASRQSSVKGLFSFSPQGRGQSHSQESSSPTASQASRSPGEEAQQLALQQQQQQKRQGGTSSLWLLRPSSSQSTSNPKRAAQRAILRVFVGAGGESSGSN